MYMEIERTGYFSRIGNSIKAALFGILVFFASFFVLYINEGLQKDGDVLQDATQISAEEVQSVDGLAAVVGEISAIDPIAGDNEVLKLRDRSAIYLGREVETYAWIETADIRDEEAIGGSVTRYTEYSYNKDWTNTPADTSSFKEPKPEYVNYPSQFGVKKLESRNKKVGAYSFDRAIFANPESLNIGQDELLKGDVVSRGLVFVSRNNGSTFGSPKVGDSLLRYYYVPSGETVTVAGRVSGARILSYSGDEGKIFKVYLGDFKQAVSTAKSQDASRIWTFRIIGFAMMFGGLLVFLRPISILFKLIPAVGSVAFFVLGVGAFIISLILTIVTIIVSIIFHNALLLTLVVAITFFVLLKVFAKKVYKKRGK